MIGLRSVLPLLVPFLVAGQRVEPLPVPPPVPRVAALPAVTRTPLDDLVPSPPLQGTTKALDLAALAHSTTVFTFTADLTALDRVTPDLVPIVLRQLAADPTWRVTLHEGATVALRREVVDKSWVTPRNGFHDDRAATRRTLLRFGPWPAGQAWSTSDLVSRVPASSAKIRVTAFTMAAGQWKDRVATALEVAGAQVALEVFEAGAEDDRSATIEALGEVPILLDGIAKRAWVVQAQGQDRALLPSGEPQRGTPWLELGSPGHGLLDVHARVNPGADGWTWMRFLDEDLRVWEEEVVAVGTRERIGWSADPAELFWFQGAFPVPRGSAFAGTAELWFQADSGGGRRGWVPFR